MELIKFIAWLVPEHRQKTTPLSNRDPSVPGKLRNSPQQATDS